MKTTSQKGTVTKYSGVVELIKGFKKPTRINNPEFSKKHNVSTNLIKALSEMGYLNKSSKGYTWNSKTPFTTATDVAERARIIMNELTNKNKPAYERPTGKRVFNGRKGAKKPLTKKTAEVKTIAHPLVKPAKRAYAKRAPKEYTKRVDITKHTPTESVKVRLARKFAALGYHQDALDLLS